MPGILRGEQNLARRLAAKRVRSAHQKLARTYRSAPRQLASR